MKYLIHLTLSLMLSLVAYQSGGQNAQWLIPIDLYADLPPLYSDQEVNGYEVAENQCCVQSLIESVFEGETDFLLDWGNAANFYYTICSEGCSDAQAGNFSGFENCNSDLTDCSYDKWHIPSTIGGGPAVFTSDPPVDYVLAENQCCVQNLVNADAICLTNWDIMCDQSYQLCADGCTDQGAFNYSPLACEGECLYYHIPNIIDGSPLEISSVPLEGYTMVNDNCCLNHIVNLMPECVLNWTQSCQDALDGCEEKCAIPEACNYSQFAVCEASEIYIVGLPSNCVFLDWYIPINISAEVPPIQSCEPIEGYTRANNCCVEALIAADSFCIDNFWDTTCQYTYENCIDGCSDATACNYNSLQVTCPVGVFGANNDCNYEGWHIPVVADGSAPYYGCSSPVGYVSADECCFNYTTSEISLSVTSWTIGAQSIYEGCVDNCNDPSACNYSEHSVCPEPGFFGPIYNCSYSTNYIPTGSLFGDQPPLTACNGTLIPVGYQEVESDCCYQEIISSSLFDSGLWTAECQEAYQGCLEGCNDIFATNFSEFAVCTSGDCEYYYLPEIIDGSQGVISSGAYVSGYYLADACCVNDVITQNPSCLTSWDSSCQAFYDACDSRCSDPLACNYSSLSSCDNTENCEYTAKWYYPESIDGTQTAQQFCADPGTGWVAFDDCYFLVVESLAPEILIEPWTEPSLTGYSGFLEYCFDPNACDYVSVGLPLDSNLVENQELTCLYNHPSCVYEESWYIPVNPTNDSYAVYSCTNSSDYLALNTECFEAVYPNADQNQSYAWNTAAQNLYLSCSDGCTNPEACNYNPNSQTDDGSCILGYTNAVAGPDQIQCNDSSFDMEASVPTDGIGTWSYVSGDAVVFSNINSPNSVVSGLGWGESAQIAWTISNGVCISSDTLYLQNDQFVNVSNGGSDQYQCQDPIFTMDPVIPSFGEYHWETDNPDVIITDPTLPNTTVTNLPENIPVNMFWVISNGVCSAQDVVILRNDGPPSTPNAGVDLDNCNSATFYMDADEPLIGTGQWSYDGPGNVSIYSFTNPETIVAGVGYSDIGDMVWTVTNGTCVETDRIHIQNWQSVTANAGSNISQCQNHLFQLDAEAPSVGIGAWIENTGVQVNDIYDVNAIAEQPLQDVSETIIWEVTNGVCSAQDVVILRNDGPPSTPNAGVDLDNCNSATFYMDADEPLIGTGQWSYDGPGNVSIYGFTNPETIVAGVGYNDIGDMVWTVTNGTCVETDRIHIQNWQSVTANAGSNISQCQNHLFQLDAEAPSVGIGAWIENTGVQVNDIYDVNAIAEQPLQDVSETIIWEVTNGVCSAQDVVILRNDGPPSTPNAGVDLDNCNSATFYMDADEPLIGTGQWSYDGPGNVSIYGFTNPETIVAGVGYSDIGDMVWTVTNGTCVETDRIHIQNWQSVTANAGMNVSLCDEMLFQMSAVNPENGDGFWTLTPEVSSISNINDPEAFVELNAQDQTVSVTWTVENGACSASDVVTLRSDAAVTIAHAGLDLEQCNQSTFLMNANAPTNGLGSWAVENGSVNIVTNYSPVTQVSGVGTNEDVTISWNITNGECSSTDTVNLFNYALPSSSNAGPDQESCLNGVFTLVGNPPNIGVGEWSSFDPDVVIVNPLNPYTQVSGVPEGETAELIWTISNNGCTSVDTVLLTHDLGGCTDITACNYESNTICDNGTCVYPNELGDCPEENEGCTNPLACNYDNSAILDNGSCLLPNGCVDPLAVNYNPTATCDNGSCLFAGCTDPTALNYDAAATFNDNSCEYVEGCTYVNSNNYNPEATVEDQSCNFCMGDFNDDGFVTVADLTGFLGAFGNACN